MINYYVFYVLFIVFLFKFLCSDALLNLEKRHAEKKRILKLKLESGLAIDDPDSMLKEQENFFKTLYLSNNDNVDNPVYDVFFKNDLISLLHEENAHLCEGHISKEECSKALADMENRKSPGSDGSTPEFYKFFGRTSLMMPLTRVHYGKSPP